MLQGGFSRKSGSSSDIPTSSQSDIAFLLLIFFMVSTVFPMEKPRRLDFPEAEATEKLDAPRKEVLHVFVERDGSVYINDALIPMEQVAAVVAPHHQRLEGRLVTSLRADGGVQYTYIDAIQKQLQAAGAVRVAFYTNLEQRVTRERR